MNMDPKNICGVVDCQGFSLRKFFFPRELSFICKDFSVCYEVVPEDRLDTSLDYVNNFKTQQRLLHGLPLQQVLDTRYNQTIKQSEIPIVLNNCFSKAKINNESLVAIKKSSIFKLYIR